ncbi:MAG TPA: hypothetical protein VFP98_10035 [Candidatus Polarisedimenticolia bacterium]|nr:hypothetical protein [Candidatus Polarisedimenticolia bacterium]
MLRRIGAAPVSGRRTVAQTPEAGFASQCLGEFLRRLTRVDPHPAVLDLGILCGGNIAFLGARGCRVSVESLPNPARVEKTGQTDKAPASGKKEAGAAMPPHPLSPLSYPPGSFSGVLAWDSIARLAHPEAVAFVETLRQLLLDGGVILAHFPGPPGNAGGAGFRYRIIGEDQLCLEPSTRRHAAVAAYQNRDIYTLFSRFDVVRLSHLKSGTREVLVARTRRPARA